MYIRTRLRIVDGSDNSSDMQVVTRDEYVAETKSPKDDRQSDRGTKTVRAYGRCVHRTRGGEGMKGRERVAARCHAIDK